MSRNETNKLMLIIIVMVALVGVMKSSAAAFAVVNYTPPIVVQQPQCDQWERIEPLNEHDQVLGLCLN